MKTRREHLSMLPAAILAQVKEECARLEINELEVYCEKEMVLTGLFIFTDTSQGRAYWWDIHFKYFN